MIVFIVVGIILCIFCYTAPALADFVGSVDDETSCARCEQKAECFGKKPVFGSDMLNRWMLVSFLKLNKKCKYAALERNSKAILCIAFAFFAFLIPFWSKGFGMRGELCGLAAIALLYLSIVDWKTQYIPLEMSGLILVCGLIQLFADLSNWLEYVIGLIAVSGFLYIADRIGTFLYNKMHKDKPKVDNVIGDGDIKLMAATGLLLGWKLNIVALMIGCIAGSVIHLVLMKIKKGERKLALGPYLSLGVYITMICGEQLVSWYLSMIGIAPIN